MQVSPSHNPLTWIVQHIRAHLHVMIVEYKCLPRGIHFYLKGTIPNFDLHANVQVCAFGMHYEFVLEQSARIIKQCRYSTIYVPAETSRLFQ